MSQPEDMLDCELRNEFGRPTFHAHGGGAVVGTSIDNSINKSLPYVIGLALLAAVSLILALWARSDAARAERESRMLQYYLLELDARVIAAGIKKEDESISKKLEKEK